MSPNMQMIIMMVAIFVIFYFFMISFKGLFILFLKNVVPIFS